MKPWNYGLHSPGDASQDMQDSCNFDSVPVAVVTTCGAEICGTAAMEEMTQQREFPDLYVCTGEGSGTRMSLFRKRG